MTRAAKLIPVHMSRMSHNDKTTLTAVASLRDAMAVDNIREILTSFEKEYAKLLNELRKMIGKLKSGTSDPIICWKLGDLMYNFLHNKASRYGVVLTNYERTLARDLKISPSRIFYLIQFRRLYKNLSEVDSKIKWSWYLELIKENDRSRRKDIESKIKSRKITTMNQLRMAISSAT